MGKLIVTELITLAGIIDSQGEGGWAFNLRLGSTQPVGADGVIVLTPARAR